MGCCGISNQADANIYQLPRIRQTKVLSGLLIININNISLPNLHNISENDYTLKLKISHQQFETKIIQAHGKLMTTESTFQFCINSLTKKNSRFLTVKIENDNHKVEKLYESTLIDLAPFLKEDLLFIERSKAFLFKQQKEQVGQIILNFDYEPYPYDYLHMRINALSTLKNCKKQNWYSVRVTIGQQILQTKPKKQSLDSVPSWKNQPFLFIVPGFITNASMKVLQSNGYDKNIFGQLTLDMRTIMTSHNQLMHSEAIYLNKKITGSITFDTSKDNERSTSFMQAISPRKVMKNQSKSSSQFEVPTQNKIGILSKTSQNSLQFQPSSEISISTARTMRRPKGKLPSINRSIHIKENMNKIQNFEKIEQEADENNRSKIQNDENKANNNELPQLKKKRQLPQNFILKLIPIQQSRINETLAKSSKIEYSFIQNPINVFNETNGDEGQFENSFMNKTLNISEIPQNQIPTRLQSERFVYDILANTMNYGKKLQRTIPNSRSQF